MTEDEIITHVTGLPGVVVITASEDIGAPEVAWGDSFIYYDPDDDPANRQMPFATIVINDYPGFDTSSNLSRPGVFRLNINVGRSAFTELIGYPPAAHPERHDRWDYSELDRLVPHPAYAEQAWVSIVNPGQASGAQARSLLTDAHARATRRHTARA